MATAGDILDAIAVYLEANSVEDVFVAKQPDTPANCVSLLGLPGEVIGPQRDVPELQFCRFQVLVRNESYADASEVFQLARTLLHNKIGLLLPTGVNVSTQPYIRILRMHLFQEGGPLGEDGQGRHEFSMNVLAEYHHVDT